MEQSSLEYTIETMSTSDTDEVMKLLKRTFYVEEPMNKSIGLFDGGTEGIPLLDDFCSGCIKEGLSLKAVDKDGHIVGVLVSGELPLVYRMAEKCDDPKFQKILHILAAREEGARLWEKYPDEKFLVEAKVAATDPKWRRKGIMNRLVARTESLLRERGVRLFRLDTSSEYSAKSAQRQGFRCVYQRLYSDIKVDGKILVAPEPPHLYDRVFIKDLKPAR